MTVQTLLDWLHSLVKLLDYQFVVEGGYALMTAIVFAETGLLIGFCLPGDSLLVTAGIFAASGKLNIVTINLLLIPASILGDQLGYWIGLKSGPRLFRKQKSLLFNPEHLHAAQGFYDRHGGKTVVIARFMPIARTFAPVVAGMGRMNYGKFLFYNIFGGVGWVFGMSMLGYVLARTFPSYINVKRIEYVIIVVVVISILPGVIAFIRNRLRGGHESLVEALAAPDEGADGTASSSSSHPH